LTLEITIQPSNLFFLSHFVVEISPGRIAENVRHPTPTYSVSDPYKFGVTKDLSSTGTGSFPPSLQLGIKHSIQEERVWRPFKWKYLASPGDYISASWEFCVMDKGDAFYLEDPDPVLPGVKFLVSKDKLQSVCVTIACYYERRPTLFPDLVQTWMGRRTVGWRNICHETHIIMPVVDWPNHQQLHRNKLPIPAPMETKRFKEAYEPRPFDAQKLTFHTSAECKAFKPHRSSQHCQNEGHGRGPQVNST
jgi:hypothetical protein